MEKFRLRRSSTSASTDNGGSSCRLREGNRQVQRQINSPNSADMCESGWRFSNRATGTPIKKLLAEEMLRETEPRRSSPGVIARLMGFDGLPTQQLSRRKPQVSAENYQQRVTSAEKFRTSGASCSRQSSRRSSKEEQEFRDVFEVSDSSKIKSSCSLLKGPGKTKLTEAEMTYVKQKLQDVKRLSTDEKLHDSKEFHDAIEALYSNQDLLLKYLEEPNSLFTKHLHDLQADPLASHCNHLFGMKWLNAQEHDGSGLRSKNEREFLRKHRKNHNKSLGHSKDKHSAVDVIHKLPNFQVEGKLKVESPAFPTRIVVLKPNSGKVQNSIRSVLSPRSSHDEHSEVSNIKDLEIELCPRKTFANDAVAPKYDSRESREIAKEITRRMRNSLERSQTKASRLKGYAGDDSSSNRSDNESANEFDLSPLVSRESIHWSNRRGRSSSHSADSSVSKEARKRLSERWKRTHRSVDMGSVGRSSTLGEMLAMSDREGRPADADSIVGETWFSDNFVGKYRPIQSVEPLGICSGEGWKEKCVTNRFRSRSVPASCSSSGSPKTAMPQETLCNEKYLLPKEVTQQERIKLVKGNSNHREASSSRNSKSRAKKAQFSVYSHAHYSDTSPEIHVSCKKVQNSVIEDDRTEKAVAKDSGLVPQDVVHVETEIVAMLSRPNTDVESPAYATANDNSSTVSEESSFALSEKGSVTKQSVPELGSPGCCKDADQPSPVSVLETPFPDDRSSCSESFENLSSDIHGLWMQIQQLKLGSESYEEVGMVMSTDEVEELCEEEGKPEESKEVCYVKDMLAESGINVVSHDSFMASLHTSESPVNPEVFEELEKRWGLGCWERHERKLLFDRVNAALAVIKQQFGDIHPWVKVGNCRWVKNGVEENIHKLLEMEEEKVNKDDEVVRESKWVDLRDEIEVVAREIEKLLMDELVNDVVLGM